MSDDGRQRVEVESSDALWRWLKQNHHQPQSVWLVTYKAADRSRYVSRSDVLDALLAFGWIDGRRMKLDDARTMQLIAPRKEQTWAKSYKERAAKLEAEGRMQAPGRAAIEQSKAEGRWNDLADVDALDVPPDLQAALQAHGGLAWWTRAAPSYRRNVLRWVAKAKRAPTRAKRVEVIAEHASRDAKVPNY